MAYTRIHPIKTTLNKALAYIENPDKTSGYMLVSGYNCDPVSASLDFAMTAELAERVSGNYTKTGGANVLAEHMIQSFSYDDKITPEQAHEIGKKWADEITAGKHEYVITTHIDKGHVHNHIIFCAADNIEHNKYHDCKQSYYHIRKLSDELCKAHNLSIIIPGGERGKKYKEWQSDQNGSTWKTQLRQDINFFIKSASTYEEFLLLMRAKGYEIKGETFGEDAAKYISFRPLDKERFVRGSARSLGKEYTKKRIRERIEKKRERKAVIPKKDYSSRKIIDTSDEKFQNSPGLQQWAAIENLKIAAQSYNEAGSLSDLEHKITVKNEAGKSAKQSVVELEHRMKNLAEAPQNHVIDFQQPDLHRLSARSVCMQISKAQ